jgi:alkylation response protein AidB-like acyl-CoA dehydrogenase
VVTCGGLIRDAGSDSLKKRLLPEIGAGKLKLALAGYEAAGRYDLAYVTCTAQESGGSWRLSGRKTVALDGASADYFLVSARSAGKVYERDGISLFLVPKDAKGLTVGAYPTQSGARAADLGLENVAVGTDALIGAPGRALPIIERAVDRAIAALCAEAIGIINALNEATLNYLKTRKQFGVAIGSFQALKHKMADMLIAAEQAQSMAIIAAVHADSEDAADRRRAISAAKAYIGQAGRLVGQHAVQMHGGMGVVDELVVSHYFKRLTMIDLTFGDADYHLASFSDTLRPTA